MQLSFFYFNMFLWAFLWALISSLTLLNGSHICLYVGRGHSWGGRGNCPYRHGLGDHHPKKRIFISYSKIYGKDSLTLPVQADFFGRFPIMINMWTDVPYFCWVGRNWNLCCWPMAWYCPPGVNTWLTGYCLACCTCATCCICVICPGLATCVGVWGAPVGMWVGVWGWTWSCVIVPLVAWPCSWVMVCCCCWYAPRDTIGWAIVTVGSCDVASTPGNFIYNYHKSK